MRTPLFYILDGKIAKQCNSVLEWGQWMEENSIRVARDYIDEIEVSTVFLGLNHNWSDQGDPLLFETMSFWPNDSSKSERWRYFTWEEAEAGHREMVDEIKKMIVNANDRADKSIQKLFKQNS